MSHLSATPSFHLWTMLSRHAKKDIKMTLATEIDYVSVRVCECERQCVGEGERATKRERDIERDRHKMAHASLTGYRQRVVRETGKHTTSHNMNLVHMSHSRKPKTIPRLAQPTFPTQSANNPTVQRSHHRIIQKSAKPQQSVPANIDRTNTGIRSKCSPLNVHKKS